MKQNILHVGSGPKRLSEIEFFRESSYEETTMDIDSSTGANIVQDAKLKNNSLNRKFDWIVAEHFLEHFEDHEVESVLDNFKEYLKDNGNIYIRVPDLDSVMKAALSKGLEHPLYTCSIGEVTARDILYGSKKLLKDGMFYYKHKTGFTSETLKKKILERGFSKVSLYRNPLNYELLAIGTK